MVTINFSALTTILILFTLTNLLGQNTDTTFLDMSVDQFMEIEQPAQFPGGTTEFLNYVSKNFKYPRKAKKNGISGKVYVMFFINTDGTVDQDSIRALSKEEVIKENRNPENANQMTDDKSLIDEAVRLIRQSPKWVPGTQRNRPVRQRIVFPLAFRAY